MCRRVPLDGFRKFNWFASPADIAATMADLQDATRLISDLTSKLAELDSKVAAYRLDMAAEFTRHSEELLRSVPEDVAYRVSRAIAEQLINYPALYPPDSLNSSRCATPTNLEDIPWRGKGSPPPITPRPSSNPKETESQPPRPRSPHEREQEFQGLFTPTYLPLLESVDRPLHSPLASPRAADATNLNRRTSIGSSQGSDSSHHRRRRPSPLRRTTDTSIDSLASDSSSGRTRKSALRRSSVSSKADSPRDPRRVRFDFQGQEVLPSSSPQTSTTALNKADGPTEKSALADATYTTSLGDIKGSEDLQGEGPRKVSSTQALRALSKEPLDKGTVWTVINPQSGLDADNNRKTATATPSSQPGLEVDDMTIKKLIPYSEQEACGHNQPRATARDEADMSQRQVAEEVRAEAEDEDSDDDPTLWMASKRSRQKKPKGASSQEQQTRVSASAKPSSPMAIKPQSLQVTHSVASSTSAKSNTAGMTDEAKTIDKKNGQKSHSTQAKAKGQRKEEPRKSAGFEDDDEEFFAFDDDSEKPLDKLKKTAEQPKKYLPETHDEEHGEHEEDEKTDTLAETSKANSDTVSNPPTNIPEGLRHEKPVPFEAAPKSEGARAPSTSIGSFVDRDGHKRSLTSEPVKDKELLEKLEKLDVEVPFFVGSVNGRSGPDASNVKSYQASLLSPTEMSGSFAERLMWEKAQGVTYESDKETDKAEKKKRR